MTLADPAIVDFVPRSVTADDVPSTADGVWPTATPEQERPIPPLGRARRRFRWLAVPAALIAHGAIAAVFWPLVRDLPAVQPLLTPVTITIDDLTVVGAMPRSADPARDTQPQPSREELIKDTPQPEIASAAAAPGDPSPPSPTKSAAVDPIARPMDKAPDATPAREPSPKPDARSQPATTPPSRKSAALPPSRAAAPSPVAARGTPQHDSGTDSPRSSVNYPAVVASHLRRFHSYPREAQSERSTGVVRVSFSLNRQGQVQSASVAQQSGSAILNAAALSAVRRASPFPAPPPGQQQLTFVVPLRFELR